MSFIQKIQQLFITEKKTVPNHEREMRELLRENLKTIAVDVFHYDDPIISMSPSERTAYLTYFHTLVNDKKVIARLEYLINKQANLTLKKSKDGVLDSAGIMKMDGMGTVKDDMTKLSAMFLKEGSEKIPINPADALRL